MDGENNSLDGTAVADSYRYNKFNWLLCLPSCHTTLTVVWLSFPLTLEENTIRNCRDGPSSKYLWMSSTLTFSIIPLGAQIPSGWWHGHTGQVALSGLRKGSLPPRIEELNSIIPKWNRTSCISAKWVTTWEVLSIYATPLIKFYLGSPNKCKYYFPFKGTLCLLKTLISVWESGIDLPLFWECRDLHLTWVIRDL